jgi:hypothetical protein
MEALRLPKSMYLELAVVVDVLPEAVLELEREAALELQILVPEAPQAELRERSLALVRQERA